MGLATSPQSLSWCASSIAAIVLVPLIIVMVTCCCCHRRRICKCGRSRDVDPYHQPLSIETENQQYEKMFAVPKPKRGGVAVRTEEVHGPVPDFSHGDDRHALRGGGGGAGSLANDDDDDDDDDTASPATVSVAMAEQRRRYNRNGTQLCDVAGSGE